MSDKVIVLFSGGLDSTVLLHYVARTLNRDVVAVFFDYSQKSISAEKESVNYTVNELNNMGYSISLIQIYLPPIYQDWEEEYLPQRNLIFLSYAYALAERYEIKEVFIGIIDPQKPEGRYSDTSIPFLEEMTSLAENIGISLYVPFAFKSKLDVLYLSKFYDIDAYRTHSCNFSSKECGKCANCSFREENKEILKKDLKYYWEGEITSDFIDKFMETKIVEARLLINNICNIQCSHCFYGYDTLKEKQLTITELKTVITKIDKAGISHVHFSGKEPLVNKDIFLLTDFIKANFPNMTYDVVTNGKNISKYIKDIEKAGFSRVCISFSGFNSSSVRDSQYTISSLKKLLKNNVEVEIFYDVDKNNYKDVAKDILSFYKLGVSSFYVRPVLYYGKALELQSALLNPEEMLFLINQLASLDLSNMFLTLHLKGSYIEGICNLEPSFKHFVEYSVKTGDTRYLGINLNLELFCYKYYNQITINADGTLLGCGLEVSQEDYARNSPGNVLTDDLEMLILQGKLNTLKESNLKCSEGRNCTLCTKGCLLNNNFCYKNF